MIVYCEDENCTHYRNGECECKWETGQEAISLVMTLGGQMICSDQKDRLLEYGDQDTMMPAT